MGQALAWANYITPNSIDSFPVQPPQAILAIRYFAGPIPAILLIIAIVFAWFYPISRQAHQALREQLAKQSN
jgi:glycoside/pentoside/hexuronide:cation symporter, GPH family